MKYLVDANALSESTNPRVTENEPEIAIHSSVDIAPAPGAAPELQQP